MSGQSGNRVETRRCTVLLETHRAVQGRCRAVGIGSSVHGRLLSARFCGRMPGGVDLIDFDRMRRQQAFPAELTGKLKQAQTFTNFEALIGLGDTG